MSLKEFGEILQAMRENCFHMNDEQAGEVVDGFIEKYPQLLNFQSREWLIHNS